MNQRTLLRQNYVLTYDINYSQLQLITLERESKTCTDVRLSSDETYQLYLDLENYFSRDDLAKDLERHRAKYKACPF
jgi:hypothetical protein